MVESVDTRARQRDIAEQEPYQCPAAQGNARRTTKTLTAIRRWPLRVAIVLAASFFIAGFCFARFWPFRQENVIKELEQVTSSAVEFGSFRRTYFPHLGCVAEHVILRRVADRRNPTVVNVDRLTIQTNPIGLLRQHLSVIRIDGAHALFAPIGTGPDWSPTSSKVVVDELDADNSTLEFKRADSHAPPVAFAIHRFTGHHLAMLDPMRFELRITIPLPAGEAQVAGSFGPWNMQQVLETPISGNYSFRQADLSAFHNMNGVLSSQGKFDGPLDSIQVEGTTTIPDFNIESASHKLNLSSAFQAQVDATNGDVLLDQVQARIRHTLVLSRGEVTQHPTEDGKTTALNFEVHQGRIQDALLLFISDKQPPLTGMFNLKAAATLPPGDQPFLRKLQMSGDFGVESALFTKSDTQESVQKLSAAGQHLKPKRRKDPQLETLVKDAAVNDRDDPERVLSDIEGHATVENGVVTFSVLRFRVPGARAKLHGTYNLISHRIDLRGTLFMDAQLPQVTTGVKSFLLKAINPFLKKNDRGGAEFPVSIKGTYESPIYAADPV